MVEANDALADAPGQFAADRSFDDFYRATYVLLIKIALAEGATRPEAEDATNQTMEEVYRNWKTIGNPRAWARKAVRSNLIKQRQRDAERSARTIAAGDAAPGQDTPAEAAATGMNVWEDRQWVRQRLERLPPAQRAVMASYLDDLTPTEIAARLGKTPATVRKNLQLARERLAAQPELKDLHRQKGSQPTRSPTPPTTREDAR